jgi:hypothetical protein
MNYRIASDKQLKNTSPTIRPADRRGRAAISPRIALYGYEWAVANVAELKRLDRLDGELFGEVRYEGYRAWTFKDC